MKVLINSQEKDTQIPGMNTLQEVIRKVEPELPMNHIITQVKLNGRLLPDKWYATADSTFILESDELDFITESAINIGKKAFLNSKAQFDQIIEILLDIADKYRMDDENIANQKFVIAVDNLQAYFQVIKESYTLMGLELEPEYIGKITVKEYMENFSAKLSELIETQQKKDWVLFADLIEYELIPFLTDFKDIYKNV